jgi:serine/threonine protein kinase
MTDSSAALPQSAAESALQSLLDAYAKKKRSVVQLTTELVDICAQQPAATWQALSLLDRYHRRGELTTALFRDLKKELNSIAFGSGRRALSAPGPEADRTSGFASIFRTSRAPRTAVHTAASTAYFEAPPRTVQIHTSRMQGDRTAQLQKSSDRTAQLQTPQDRTAQRETPNDGTANLQTSEDRTSQRHTPADSTAHLQTQEHTQRDSTMRLGGQKETPPHLQGPEPRTQWLDGQPESDTEYFSSTELRQSHGTARPTGTVVQDLQRDATLTRGQRTQQRHEPENHTHSAIEQAEAEQAEQQREVLTQAALAQSPSLRPGAVLMNRYVLVEPLSNGGIGVVFKALDHQRAALPESQRYVAIKCLHESLQNEPRAIAALQHEYRQSQALSHPNIAKVYDFHQADGVSFLALELVEGESLARICERIAPRRLPPSRALTIVREIGHAIAHAHENGILHGNLNPNNVVVTRSGHVRVREFGQATAWLDSAAAADNIVRDIPPSQPEQRYRSPQQKSAIPTDAADDIYSLACIAFELLCGRSPDAQAHKTETRKPAYASHLNPQRWQALQIGLADARTQRGNDVRQWLAELDLSSAAIRLPSLSDLETELFGGEESIFSKPWLWASVAAAVAAISVVAWLWVADSPSPSVAATSESSTDVVDAPLPVAQEPAVVTAAPAETTTQLTSDSIPESTDTLAAREPQPSTSTSSPPSASEASPTLPTVSFSQARYEIPADAAVAALTIERRGATNKRLVLQWFSIEGSAKSDFDYVRDGNTTVVMQPGQRNATVTIPLIKSEARDRAAWFDVRIRATTDAMPGAAVVATVYLMPTLSQTISP